MPDSLTEVQRKALNYIRAYIRKNGWAPTRKELAEAMGWASTNRSAEVIAALVKKGRLIQKPGAARALRLP